MEWIRKLALHPVIHLLILTLLVWLVFSRTLGSYFLADDFGEVAYAGRIFAGNYDLLWSDFTSNFMQVPGMAVWRPWLMISLLLDFCIWRANPFGFYLTNLLSYNVVVILFYLLIRRLMPEFKKSRGSIAALLAGAIFAVSPLHCESVSWVVGRVDIICAVFYLACLNLSVAAERAFDDDKTRAGFQLTTMAVVSFWIAMWCKEMAIGAPVMVTAIILLFGRKPLDVRRTCSVTAPIWISTIIYFILRYLALGTFLGGYVQGIGDSQAANALARWSDFDTVKRLLFPLANNIFGDHPWQLLALQSLYLISLTLVLIRIISMSISFRWMAFIVVWAITCLAPLYKLWGLGYDLEGGRFCFFLTMPLSLLAPALIMLQGKKRPLETKIDYAICVLGICSLLSTAAILAKVAFLTNLDWVHAGQELRECTREASALSSTTSSDKKTLILGIPKRNGGAHMLLNGNSFATALKPPFMERDFSQGLLTFDPIQFAESPNLNSDRLKRLIRKGDMLAVWNSEQRQFQTIHFENADTSSPSFSLAKPEGGYIHQLGRGKSGSNSNHDGVIFDNIADGDSLAFNNLKLNPLNADFIEVTLRVLDHEQQPVALNVSLDDKSAGRYKSSETSKSIRSNILRVPLSLDWHWYSKPQIDSIFLMLPPGRKIEITGCRLIATNQVAPVIQSCRQESYEGTWELNFGKQSRQSQSIDLPVELPPLQGVERIQVEISKPNAFYENFPANNGDAAIMEMQSWPCLPSVARTQKLKVNAEHLSHGLFYQLRVRMLDKAGNKVGELSCPVTVKIE